MSGHTIGNVAKRVGIGVETVRFYERKGLVKPPPRSPAGYRLYPDAAVDRLRFVLRAKELGFTLDQIRTLLELRVGDGTSCDEVRSLASERLADVEDKLRQLQRIAGVLREVITTCDDNGRTGECPILDTLHREADDVA